MGNGGALRPFPGEHLNLWRRLNRLHLAIAFGMLLAAGLGYYLHDFKIGSALERASYDYLTVAGGAIRPEEAVIVYLDEESHDKLKQSFKAGWDRSLHGQLIDRLSAAGARAIVFDIVFSDPDTINPAADARLAAAIKQSGRVILAADNVRMNDGSIKILPPTDAFRNVAAGIGSDEVDADSDVVVRRHTPRGDNPLSSLSWAAAVYTGAKVAQRESQEYTERWVHYYGPPNTLRGLSYYEALDPTASPDDSFKGKVVFVGARILTKFAGERKDEYQNPFSRQLTQTMLKENRLYIPGVEIQATEYLNLARNDWLRRLPLTTEKVLIIAFGLLIGWGLVRLQPLWAASVAIGALLLTLILTYFIFLRSLVWFPWIILIVQILAALSWSILFNSVQLYVQKRLYEQTLRLYLPPKLVKKFAKTREFLKPGAQKQTLTLMFSDIANFTSTSEGMDSDELADMMNNYFQMAVGKCIHKADGTVAKFIGDAIFAFWNAPDEQAEHALLACQSALLFHENASQPINGRILPTRIGLHTGVANVGNFGSEDRYASRCA